MYAMELQNVSKVFQAGQDKGRFLALDQVDLAVEAGSFTSIVGPSGCGKSTLLRLVAGVVAPTNGTVIVAGEQIVGPRDGVGFVFQQPTLLPWRTVIDNVLLPAEVKRSDKRRMKARATELLELVGLEDFMTALPDQLSGGMQQRVGICRALLTAPQLLLMDEPFGALDAMTRDYMNLALLDIWAMTNTTILFVTHSITEAVFLSDRVMVMSPRPGTVRDLIDIELPHPRELAVLHTAEAGTYVGRIREYFAESPTGQTTQVREA